MLERLRADLAEHVDDEGVPPDEAVAACVADLYRLVADDC